MSYLSTVKKIIDVFFSISKYSPQFRKKRSIKKINCLKSPPISRNNKLRSQDTIAKFC